MARQQWIVLVSDEHLHRLDAIVDALEAAVLHVDQVLRVLGRSPAGLQLPAVLRVLFTGG